MFFDAISEIKKQNTQMEPAGNKIIPGRQFENNAIRQIKESISPDIAENPAIPINRRSGSTMDRSDSVSAKK